MNKKLRPVIVFFAMLISMNARAQSYNNTVMTTSDGAPTYPTSSTNPNRNTEVVIGTASNQSTVTTSVTLTSTCVDGGKVTMSYTYSSGISFAAGYPQGSNTGTEIAKFTFDSTTIGKVNTIQVVVAGRLDSSGAYCSVNNSNAPVFKICIPQITVVRSPGDITTNNYDKLLFYTMPTIKGCDDFSQIEWIQQITNNSSYTTYTGTPTNYINYGAGTTDDPSDPSGWTSPSASASWPFTISGNTATLSAPYDQHIDDDSAKAGTFQIGGTGTTYHYSRINSEACTFQDKICRTADSAALGEFDWSFTWDNNNDTWPASPSMGQYTTATSNTSGVYGGAGTATHGEFSNVTGVTIP